MPAGPPDTHASGRRRSIAYIPGLDGVRGLAVICVMAYHSGISFLSGGFFSIDAFFVLSGFLITSLLITEWGERATIALSRFWVYRARRLVPALFLLLVFVVLYARFVAPAGTYPDLRVDALSTLFYAANWHFIATGANYFAQTSAPSLLTHTWTLAIEEQFYVVWPLVVLLVLRLTRDLRVLLALCAAGALASALEMALLYRSGASLTRLYYGTDTHAQSLLIGATLAVGFELLGRRSGSPFTVTSVRARRIVGGLGLAGIAASGLLWSRASFSSASVWRGGFLVAAISSAVVVACASAAPQSVAARALSWAPLRFVGRVSYGLYLWHYPLFQWIDGARTGLTGYPLFGIRCAATFAIATASFYLVERPIRRGTLWRGWWARLGTPAAVGGVVAVVLAATVSTTPVVAATTRSANPAVTGDQGPVVLLVGDSTAETFGLALGVDAPRFRATSVNEGIFGCGVAILSGVQTQGADVGMKAPCNASTPADRQWPALWTGWLSEFHPSVVAVLAGRWETGDVKWRGQWTNIESPAFADYVEQQLRRAISVASAQGAKVVMMTAPCADSGEQPDGQPWPEDSPTRLAIYNGLVRDAVRAAPTKASLYNLDAVVCPGGHFETTVDGVTVRAPDGVHFPFFSLADPYGADPDPIGAVKAFGRWIGPKIWPTLLAVARTP